MTTARTNQGTRALGALIVTFLAPAIVALAFQAVAQAQAPGVACHGSYRWPVRPLDEPHPIRANFGDPRTRFDGPSSPQALLQGDGTFSFHQGVDISAPDGSPVYPVASGRVTFARGQRVTVDCGNGRSFQYWHIFPSVRVGQRVEAGKTVLGFIQPKREHVHLTHLQKGRAVNPLAPGNLAPYRDETAPEVIAVRSDAGAGLRDPLRGRVTFVVEAVDAPATAVPGRWHGFPVTPARLTWRIEGNGRDVIVRRVARDVGRTEPKNDRFWDTFARGTHQNWPIFDHRKYQFRPGRYLFRLSPKPFDTRQLRDGAYVLVVTATDTAGNRDQSRLRFAVDNWL